MWTRSGVFLISLIAVVAFAPEASGGGVPPAATTVTLDVATYESDPAPSTLFVGLVSSAKGRCERNRAIEVYRIVDGPDSLIGITNAGGANGEGREWAVQVNGFANNGNYYAKAPATPRCKADRSPRYELISCMPRGQRGGCRAAKP